MNLHADPDKAARSAWRAFALAFVCTFIAAAALAQPAAGGQGPGGPGGQGADRPPPERGAQTLTPEQQAQVKRVLAPYKAATLTVADAKAIKRALRDAGIRPGPGLAVALRAQGFSAEKLEELDPRPARPPGERGERGGRDDGTLPPAPPPPPVPAPAKTGRQ